MAETAILLGGPAGLGTATIEKTLLSVLIKAGYYLFSTKNYMSRIRGGHNYHIMRVSETEVPGIYEEKYNIIVALDDVSEAWHKKELNKNGLLLNSQEIKNKFSNIKLQNPGEINLIISGYILGLLGINTADLKNDPAVELLLKGYQIAEQSKDFARYKLKPKNIKQRLIINGNQALALGAIAGDCQFMSGYPTTPATGIMEYFSERAEKYNLHFEQAEDEISAINTALGASYAGLRSMVATSGGGMALMQEGISLAGMTETPIVIMLAQRPAPATGLPTRTEQADLNFCVYAGHGEFQRIILTPGSIAECVELGRIAFRLADTYQLPVFVLTDQYLADSYQVPAEDVKLETDQRVYAEQSADYRRYALTKNNISPLTYPGLSDALVKVDSDEHNESGKITEDLNLRKLMVNKRMRKLPENFFVKPSVFGAAKAKTIVYCWGSNKLLLESAVAELNKTGYKIKGIHFSQVFPLAKKELTKLFGTARNVISLENNYSGQLANLLKQYDINTTALLNKYDGKPFTIKEIVDGIKRMLKNG